MAHLARRSADLCCDRLPVRRRLRAPRIKDGRLRVQRPEPPIAEVFYVSAGVGRRIVSSPVPRRGGFQRLQSSFFSRRTQSVLQSRRSNQRLTFVRGKARSLRTSSPSRSLPRLLQPRHSSQSRQSQSRQPRLPQQQPRRSRGHMHHIEVPPISVYNRITVYPVI